MSPVAIVFSSGDQESHVHPRALVLGISAAFAPKFKWNRPQPDGTVETVRRSFAGHEEGSLFSPLFYSTELSRSVAKGSGYKAYAKSKDAEGNTIHTKVANSWLAKDDDGPFDRLSNARIVEKLTCGLKEQEEFAPYRSLACSIVRLGKASIPPP